MLRIDGDTVTVKFLAVPYARELRLKEVKHVLRRRTLMQTLIASVNDVVSQVRQHDWMLRHDAVDSDSLFGVPTCSVPTTQQSTQAS